MIYNDFLKKISNKLDALFIEINANYNFDYGDEFEIALCKALRVILPSNYGICRGFIVDKEGNKAGDDIIIFDTIRFPTLRLLEDKTFGQKEEIPFEAVYAYIEAKYTLHFEGNSGQTTEKAFSQIAKVKQLKRNEVKMHSVVVKNSFSNINYARPDKWPNILNPLFTAVFAKSVAVSAKKNAALSPEEALEAVGRMKLPNDNPPDLVVCGDSVLVMPGNWFDEKNYTNTPFHTEASVGARYITSGLAFATGISALFWALDSIQLGAMPWVDIIADGVGIEVNYDK